MENIPFEYINISEFSKNFKTINKFKVENIISKYKKINDQYIT